MHALPELPYAYNALEPYISETTLQIHHGKHHAAYANKLNSLIAGNDSLEALSIEELVETFATVVPLDSQSVLKPQVGQYYNHCLYWTSMTPQSNKAPTGNLAVAINEQFGDFETFKKQFGDAGLSQFGSGWAWLCVNQDGKLLIEKTSNEDTPLFRGNKPIITMDVWEHAYYLDYQNRRPDYIQNFFNVIDWESAEIRFVIATK